MTDSTDPMRVLVAAVELGGFTAAAERLELTPSAVSKIVARLEERLGVRLLKRTTRRIGLTPEGESYFAGAKFILAEIDEMEAAVGASSTHPKGLLRVNSGSVFATTQLMQKLPIFLDRYPDVSVSVDITDRIVDLQSERADLAIRAGPVGDTSLVVRKIADIERVICAAPSYLARHGTPRRPEDLAHHSCLLVADQPQLGRWPFRTESGITTVEVKGQATVAAADALVKLAIAGAGIVRLGDMIVAEAIQSGTLVPLLDEFNVVEPVPIAAVYPGGRHRSPKVRVFADFLIEQFRHAPWRIPRQR
ncbi:LysR family transcriptional regulator [Desertibaculum subflavum]|uniref:LysR family transcriptional regulator n=1 Tax=Desertibaculum subflavum TaxID=2268458 RepID=UPI0034D1718A